MAIPYSTILARVAVKIGDVTDEAEEKLDFVNDKLFEINSIDFCNPLGYIMGKALPPQGPVQKAIDKYAGKLKKFTDKLGKIDLKEKALNQLDEAAGTTEEELRRREQTIKDLLEIKREIDEIQVPPEFTENIPGAGKIAEKLARLKLSLDIAEGVAVDQVTPLDLLEQTKEFQAVKTFLLPFTNPINAINTFFADEVADVNKIIKDFIRPDKIAESVEEIIKLVVAIEKLLQKVLALLQMINMIVKICNILIKVYLILAKLLKKLPIPARWQTTGSIVKASDKANEMEHHKAKELQDFLKVLSAFIDSVMVDLASVRDEIITMIVALEQLKQNLQACPFTKDNYLQEGMDAVIGRANETLSKLEQQAPQLKNIEPLDKTPIEGPENNRDGNSADGKYDLIYKGYGINIEKEENVVDENITVRRRYAMIFDTDGSVKDETELTYSTKDSIIFNEAKFLIDTYGEVASPDENPNTLEDSQVEEMLGISLADAQKEQNEAQQGVKSLINELVEEKNLQQDLEKKKKEREKQAQKQAQEQRKKEQQAIEDQPDEKRVKEVARIVNSLTVEDFYNFTVRKYAGIGYIGGGRSAGRFLIRQLGGLKNTKDRNLVKAITGFTTKSWSNSINRNRIKERRLDKKNITSVIAFLKYAKKYTDAEIQAGLQYTALIKRANFSIDRNGKIKFKIVGL